jgi:CBS domain-containing protein
MTESVVTAPRTATLGDVATLMRDHNVGSIVICDDGRPQALITDRDVAIAMGADAADRSAGVASFATRPLVTAQPEMEIEEAAALMVQNRIRRLPVLDGDNLTGILTLDDLAVRVGDVRLAQQMTAEVARAALPEFYFHERGG